MKRIVKQLGTVIGILLIATACAWSAEEQEGAGFHGNLTLGAIVYSGRPSQLSVSEDNERLDHINQEADSETVVAPAFLGDLSYHFQKNGTVLTFSTEVDNAGALDYLTSQDGIVLTLTQPLAGGSIVTASIGYGQAQVWKNPYLTRVHRSETDARIYRIGAGFQFAEDRGAYFKGTQLHIRIEDDVIGDRVSDLRREGDIYELEAGYRFKLGEASSLAAGLVYFRKNLEGRSNSADTFVLHLTHELTIGRFIFNTEGAYGQGKNDHRHPVFGRTVETTQWALSETLVYTQLFDNPRLSLYVLAAYANNDANIDFYDSDGLAAGVGINYSF